MSDRTLRKDVDEITGTYAKKMANESAQKAPVDTGALRNSITASVKKHGDAEWSYGSNLPYARRQEYEHSTKKAFFRESVWNNRDPYKNALVARIKKTGR